MTAAVMTTVSQNGPMPTLHGREYGRIHKTSQGSTTAHKVRSEAGVWFAPGVGHTAGKCRGIRRTGIIRWHEV